jgi:MFS family permease
MNATVRPGPLRHDAVVPPRPVMDEVLAPRTAVIVFLAFALAYFLSALLRAITATLSPTLSAEMALNAGDLGLLAGGYFFGFALTQLPLGNWLDRHGPRTVILGFLGVAVAGCAAFALATNFTWLLAARVLTGMGVSACLMAPLTGYRRWLTPLAQMRANSWMLMTGSFGMVAATLPVQWLMPLTGWRGLFWVLGGLILLSMLGILWTVPRWRRTEPEQATRVAEPGYGMIWRHPYFRQMVPIGLINYGGMIAMQTLWAGPWMVKIAGYTPEQAAGGLFGINLAMLCTFCLWGMFTPRLAHLGWRPEQVIAWGMPLSFVVLGAIVLMGEHAGWPMWALYCVSCTFVSLSQPAVALALPEEAAGRALSGYNLVIFGGVFLVQWGIGLLIDGLAQFGGSELAHYRGAIGIFGVCSVLAYALFLRAHLRREVGAGG